MILKNHVKIIINIKPTFAFFYLFIFLSFEIPFTFSFKKNFGAIHNLSNSSTCKNHPNPITLSFFES